MPQSVNSNIQADFEKVANRYEDEYALHGHSVKSLFIPKGRQKERFDALTDIIQRNT